MSYYTSFKKKPLCWNREDQDVSNVSEDLIMPNYSSRQEPYVETPHWEAGKYDGIKGLIESFKKISAWLKNEKAKPIVDVNKVKRFEARLAEIKQHLETEARYIMLNFKIDINQLTNAEHVK